MTNQALTKQMLKALEEEASARAEYWYSVAEKLWKQTLDREPTYDELWAFRFGNMIGELSGSDD